MTAKVIPLTIGQIARKYEDNPYRELLYYHMKAGNVPYLKQGKHYFIWEKDFLEWREKYNAGQFTSGCKVTWRPEVTAQEFSRANQA